MLGEDGITVNSLGSGEPLGGTGGSGCYQFQIMPLTQVCAPGRRREFATGESVGARMQGAGRVIAPYGPTPAPSVPGEFPSGLAPAAAPAVYRRYAARFSCRRCSRSDRSSEAKASSA